jgi:integrase
MPLEDINRKEVQWENCKKNDFLLGDLNNHNKELSRDFLGDFELGLNVPKSVKGRRSPGTLLKLKNICVFMGTHIPNKDFEKITKRDLHTLFDRMAKGEIVKASGTPYRDVGDYIKNVKTLWGWLLKTKKVTEDITEDLSRAEHKRGKPPWVFLEHDEMKLLIDQARGDYRALILFMYDTGLRPQEAYRIRIKDFQEDFTLLNVLEKRPDGQRVSKTFERTIKLKQCSALIKEFVNQQKLKGDDLLFIQTQFAFNKYLRTLSKKLFGERETKARGSTSRLKLYDIRHNSACFWFGRYRRNSDMMYRFGWKREDKVFYYSELLGKHDAIDDDDMLTSEDKTKYEKEIEELKKTNEMFMDFMKGVEAKLEEIPNLDERVAKWKAKTATTN